MNIDERLLLLLLLLLLLFIITLFLLENYMRIKVYDGRNNQSSKNSNNTAIRKV